MKSATKEPRLRTRRVSFACLALLLVAAYLSTLMWDINGSDSDFAVDVGEFQVALPLWGTVHHTGYPTYTLLGSPFVLALRWLGVAPAAGAALFSLLWAVLALGLLAALLARLTGRMIVGAAAALAIGLTLSIWIHGSLAEVYSLSLALTTGALLLAVQLREQWSDRKGWLLTFLAGLGVSHHRLVALLLPVLAVWLYPAFIAARRVSLPRWLAMATLTFLAGFLPYLDMVLRFQLGWSDWHYGYLGSWDGFWWVFWGKEVRGLQQPLTTLPELIAAAAQVGRVLWEELHWPGALLVAAGAPLALAGRRSRRAALLFLSVAAIYIAFAVVFVEAVLLAAFLLPATVGLLAAAAVGFAQLRSRWHWASHATVAAFALLAGFYFFVNRPPILAITRDQSGLEYIARLQNLDAPPGATVMAPWGRRFFALSYAGRVEGRYPGWTFVDHRAPFAELLQSQDAIYTRSDTFYVFGLDWWERAFGAPPHLSAAGPGWVAVSDRSLATQCSPQSRPGLDGAALDCAATTVFGQVGDVFALADWQIDQSSEGLDVRLCWQAAEPLEVDYSTFVYAATAPQVTEPGQLIAQTDHFAPVDGWNPTSRWAPGEVVCDAHLVPLPPEAAFDYVIAGMYSRDDAGGFAQLGELHWERAGSTWVLEP